jgi:hypothetical protein
LLNIVVRRVKDFNIFLLVENMEEFLTDVLALEVGLLVKVDQNALSAEVPENPYDRFAVVIGAESELVDFRAFAILLWRFCGRDRKGRRFERGLFLIAHELPQLRGSGRF